MITRLQADSCAAILRHILYGEQTHLDPRTDWDAMMELLQIHGLDSMVDCCSDPSLSPVSKPEKAFGHALYRRTLRQTIRALFLEMEKRGIRAAVLKGIALENCYPAGVVRTSGDIDLYLPGPQRPAFTEMMADLGIERESSLQSGQTGVETYVTPAGVTIEAHYIIFYRLGARQRKLLREKGYFSDRFFVRGDDPEIPYWTLSTTEHLFYLVYHSSKHLLSHDLAFRMLADLTVFVNRHGDEIDWPLLRQLLGELRLTRLANAQFCYCVKHLGMRSDCWARTGAPMEEALRAMLCSASIRLWERFYTRRYVWVFYPVECLEREGEYFIRYTYHPLRALKNLSNLFIFVAWRLVRWIWDYEVDTSGDIT